MTDLKVAVVGCGGMGTIHARNLAALDVFVTDPAPLRGRPPAAECRLGRARLLRLWAVGEDDHSRAVAANWSLMTAATRAGGKVSVWTVRCASA